MNRKNGIFSLNKVAWTGLVIATGSVLTADYTVHRPTRLSPGLGIRLFEILPWGLFFTLSLVVGVFLLSLVRSRNKYLEFSFGLTGEALLLTTFIIAGIAAKKLVDPLAPFGRSSLGAAVWLVVLGAYLVVYSSLQSLKSHRILRLVLYSIIPAAIVLLTACGTLDELSIMKELAVRKDRFVQELFQHLILSGSAVGIGTILGIPLGIWSFRNRTAEKSIFSFVNFVQTVPGLALFGLLVTPLAYISTRFPVLRQLGIRGIGIAPALIALTLYTLLPITRNTFTSLRVIQSEVLEAGIGMGMNNRQLLFRVEIPLATPVVLAGVRIAAVQTVGNATLAALIGSGGLGVLIFQGLGQAVPDLILLGAIPIIMVAVLIDAFMQLIILLLTPKGISGESV